MTELEEHMAVFDKWFHKWSKRLETAKFAFWFCSGSWVTAALLREFCGIPRWPTQASCVAANLCLLAMWSINKLRARALDRDQAWFRDYCKRKPLGE